MRTILFTNARDEDNIEEWIIHHRFLGFDTIYIIDHLSKEPLTERLKIFDNVIVERCDLPPQLGLKGRFTEKCVTYAQLHQYDWMIYLDADEYLFIRDQDSVQDFLSNFNSMSEVGLNWVIFGSNNFDDQPHGLIMNNFIRSRHCVDQHLKSFVRPLDVTIRLSSTHFYHINNPNRMCDPNGNPIPLSPFNPNLVSFESCVAYIAHYMDQSYQMYYQRKVNVPRDDIAEPRETFSKEIFHARYQNDVINTQLKDKYAERVLSELKRLCPDRSYYFE
jgi:hypothetical protein